VWSFVVYLRTKFSICFDHCLPFRGDVKKSDHLLHDGSVRLEFMRGWLRLCESERLCEPGIEHPLVVRAEEDRHGVES
jgi:hypothetical protein